LAFVPGWPSNEFPAFQILNVVSIEKPPSKKVKTKKNKKL